MAAIILPHRHYTQPQGRVQVDLSGRLFDPSLVSVLLLPSFSVTTDVLSGVTYPVTMPSPVTTNASGQSFARWTSENSLIVGSVNDVFNLTNCTIITATVRTSAEVNSGTLHGVSGTASSRILTHLPFTDNVLYFDYGNATEGSGRISTSIAAFLAAGTVNVWGLVAGSRGREIWRNGKRLANNAGNAGRPSSANDAFAGALSSNSPNHTTNLLLFTKEELSESALETLTASPYQMFRATTTRIYSLAAATIPTLSAPGVTDITATSARPQVTLTY